MLGTQRMERTTGLRNLENLLKEVRGVLGLRDGKEWLCEKERRRNISGKEGVGPCSI